jgi:hypothetical protein
MLFESFFESTEELYHSARFVYIYFGTRVYFNGLDRKESHWSEVYYNNVSPIGNCAIP